MAAAAPAAAAAVLIVDTDMFAMNTNVSKDVIVKLINRNVSILWTTKVSFDSQTNEVTPLARLYRPTGLHFKGEITGLLGTWKSMHDFRKRFCNHPNWLQLPTCIIDNDENSVIKGGWDFGCIISNYFVHNDMNNDMLLDVVAIIRDINRFLHEWSLSSSQQQQQQQQNLLQPAV